MSQRQQAAAAGLSKHQEKQARRVANIPDDEFEALVESDVPPTITALADLGTRHRAVGLSRVVFSRGKDDWETPAAFFAALDAEFAFTTDAAAVAATAKCPRFFGPGSPWAPDALAVAWPRGRYFLNPPYSQTAAFIAKAAAEAARGSLVVCLVASRTDVRWWHAHVYDGTTWSYRPGVAVRFLKGRLQFVGGQASAPFPSVVLVFQGRTAS